ncbi:phospholipase D-like domain-containing protein, partial [Desulfovibrio desulfuricans]|nr:phospholipase D-like domain-containing protein [Desulfovibrio desulfuricans]
DKKMVFKVTRSYYEPLVNGGVRIYEYTPGFIHAKNFVCDDKIATVGTINLDYRSLYLHFECGVYMYDVPAIKDIKEDFLKT